ncbi:uncharacterized protein LOC135349005 [Halichondria panicea]|uniref:uncharacterized protein LOC135349005 n=1 Tax=Halichondria panicea TaxID=6063 RepID=UPI00312B2B78
MASKNAQSYSGSSITELPYHQDGSVDWDTLGNIITGNMLAEVVYASYVDKKHGIPTTESFTADTDWEFSSEVDNIVVLKKKSERTFWLGRGVIEIPVRVVAEYVKDVRSSRIWDKLLVEAKYLKVLKETETCTDYIGYQRWEDTNCFVTTKRDMLYFVRCAYLDGKYVHTAISVEDPEYPDNPDIIRVNARAGCGFVLEPYQGDESRTLFNYLGNIDLKGVPMFIMSKILKAHPVCAIQALRKHFNTTQSHQSPWLFSSFNFRRRSRAHSLSTSINIPFQ